jgi:hypothetical protein
LIIQYYDLPININRFVNKPGYLEEFIKNESFNEHIKRFDEKENVEIEEFKFIGKKFKLYIRDNYQGNLIMMTMLSTILSQP